MLNWTSVTQVSNAKTNFKRFNRKLSFFNIESMKKSGNITIPLLKSPLLQYEFHFDWHRLAKPGVPVVQRQVEIATKGREFVF